MDLNNFYYIYIMCYYLSVITLIILSVSAIDEIFIDITYWVYWVYRKYKMRKYQSLTYSKLCSKSEEPIAIMIPCFNDAKIIESMLSHNYIDIDYENYKIFVGVYENDIDTFNTVKSFSELNDRVILCTHKAEEEFNKAQNLNKIYKNILHYEEVHNIKFSAFVFHDAVDLIHPVSLKMYNYLVERKDIVQLPVFPMKVQDTCFTHWIFNDEMAEINTKNLVVREVLGGFIPSIGSSISFARRVIEILVNENNGAPFSTEKENGLYSTCIMVKLKNLSQIFVTKHIYQNQWRRRATSGKYYLKRLEVYISTSSLYPLKYRDAVKEKTKIILSTAFQRVKKIEGKNCCVNRYELIHDRKILITYFLNLLAIILLIFWFVYSYFNIQNPKFSSLKALINENNIIYGFLIFFSIAILQRLLQRMIAVYRVYSDLISVLLSIPRAVYENVINAHALLRAYMIFLFAKKSKRQSWNKVNYDAPNLKNIISKKKLLGDLLLEKKLLTKQQLIELLQKQQAGGKFLGKLAVEHNYLNESQLDDLLSEQFQISKVPYNNIHVLGVNDLPISNSVYNWLISNELFPIKIFNNKITIALKDPSNILLIGDLNKKLKPLHVILCLIYSH